jgi:hypothetical protein
MSLIPTGTAWDFDQSTNEWLKADSNFMRGKPFTFAAIEYRRTGAGTNLFSISVGSAEYSLYHSTDYIFNIDGLNTVQVAGSLNTWNTVVAREVSGTSHKIRVNGTEATSSTDRSGADPTAASVYIGNFNNGGGTVIDAIVARCAFWDCELTDAEVAAFEAGVPPGEIRPGQLLSWLEFDAPHQSMCERMPGVSWSWQGGTHKNLVHSANPAKKRLDGAIVHFPVAAAAGGIAAITGSAATSFTDSVTLSQVQASRVYYRRHAGFV